jgi:hypothetical protein
MCHHSKRRKNSRHVSFFSDVTSIARLHMAEQFTASSMVRRYSDHLPSHDVRSVLCPFLLIIFSSVYPYSPSIPHILFLLRLLHLLLFLPFLFISFLFYSVYSLFPLYFSPSSSLLFYPHPTASRLPLSSLLILIFLSVFTSLLDGDCLTTD